MNHSDMKLFAFQSKGHGQYSFFVMAANENDAYDLLRGTLKKISTQPDPYTGSRYRRMKIWIGNAKSS